MRRFADYECPQCKHVEKDLFIDSNLTPKCCGCSTNMEITWKFTKHMNTVIFKNSMTDVDGRINAPGADVDPICRLEMAMDEDTTGLCALPIEERWGFLEKRIKDGDSPKLRNEILEAREERLKAPPKETIAQGHARLKQEGRMDDSY